MRIARAKGAVGGLLLVACTQAADERSAFPVPQQPVGWDNELRMTDASDDNADPNVFETTLVAQIANIEILPGKLTPVWTYNGVFPGPVIHVKHTSKSHSRVRPLRASAATADFWNDPSP